MEQFGKLAVIAGIRNILDQRVDAYSNFFRSFSWVIKGWGQHG